MKESEAYAVLGWQHPGEGNQGDQWLGFRCPTPNCQSEGVSRSREYDFGRCGICGAIMEIVDPTNARPPAQQKAATVPATEEKPKPAEPQLDVPKEIASAQRLGEQLEELIVRRGQCPDEERCTLLVAYWALIFDFHKAILSLIPNRLFGSAFALVRPCLEALARAHVAVKGSAEDVKKLRDDTYVTDFGKIGPWIDKEFGGGHLFTSLFGKAQTALHSYTHAGLSQLGRRFVGHDLKVSFNDGEIVEVIRVCTSAVWMVNNLLTIFLGFRPEANEGQRLYIEWGKHE